MRNDSRLSRTLHVLLHMARHEGPMTSEAIGRMLGTNPVVVRRTMAGLRNAGYVRSEKGHGGGWSIAADLDAVSLLDVHRAVGGPRVFAIGSDRSNPECAVEKAVNEAIEDTLREAEALLIARLGSVSLAQLARGFDARCHVGKPTTALGCE
ncbi:MULTISPECIES: Rrf2 family transcriptional regulator [unclassified Methylobacterium]|uniref:Rrf2 family transcriptional regulator n=1 Tax=unclassified Methylobacterium TaxID=2615210 RepID=UPI0006FB1C5C|nr:Rrf2 family transcriptional regulator [Methylobacterium sp. Leaf86]KQO52247.1 BadM/Rrf2 family transcriptional regulator [Methylobacterium sp. Leaf86]